MVLSELIKSEKRRWDHEKNILSVVGTTMVVLCLSVVLADIAGGKENPAEVAHLSKNVRFEIDDENGIPDEWTTMVRFFSCFRG